MTSAPIVVTLADAAILATSVAARLAITVIDAQAARGSASIVLTGGGVGIATLRALAASPLRDAVDWAAIDIWWGDERFLPAGDPERNETQARDALLDGVAGLDPARLHPMAASDGPDGLDIAANRYAETLGSAPAFDVLMLGMGPEGHIASLFPGAAGLTDERLAIGVPDSPKPPPQRISMTLATINRADHVWIIAAGAEKAAAVSAALGGAPAAEVPVAGARGRVATRYLLDEAAASLL